MAITLLNDFDQGDSNLDGIMETLNKTYKGMARISLTNFNNDDEPVVKLGSVFENKGSLYIVDTDDITPSGYDDVNNSNAFYLYYDLVTDDFIYSMTVPAWNDDYQGYYDGNNRALYSMFKASAGIYRDKLLLLGQNGYNIPGALNVVGHGVFGEGLENGNVRFKIKKLTMGEWNMQSQALLTINHSLPDFLKIIAISAVIIQDDNFALLDFNAFTSSSGGFRRIECDATQVRLYRDLGGTFDSTAYNSLANNRGFVYITYEV